MHRAEALPGAIGAGQQLLRGDRAVANVRRRQAVVAIAAGRPRALRRNSRAGAFAGSLLVSASATSASSLPIETRLKASDPVDSSIMRRCCTISAGRKPSRRSTACRRGRRGRSPGSRLRCSSADRDGATKRTSGLSIPMPNAMVATMTMPSSLMKRSWWRRADARRPARRDRAAPEYRPWSAQRSDVLDLGARQAVDDAGVAAGVALGDERSSAAPARLSLSTIS